MDNPGDSSSESDISDPWSLVDRDSCDTDEISGVNSGVGELSDGESLEVIDEDQHESEFQEAGIDTDGVSVITDSEINEDLEQTLPAALFKEKKYLHHPNTYLNTRLNVLLALSFAAVTGLGVGHFLGLQEECPLLETTLSAQLTKLQQENEFLQHKLNQLQHERQMCINYKNIEDWEYGLELKLKNDGVDLDMEVKKLPSQQSDEHILPEHRAEFGYEELTRVNPGAFYKVRQSNRDLVENEINSNYMKEQKENAIGSIGLDEKKEDVIVDTLFDEYSFSNNADDEEDDPFLRFLRNLKANLMRRYPHLLNNKMESDKYVGNVDEDSNLHNSMDVEENLSNIVEIKDEAVEKFSALNEEQNVINVDNKESDSDSSFMIKGEENYIGMSSVTNDKFIYPSNNEENLIISDEHVTEVDENTQQNHIYPEVLEDAIKESSFLAENNLQMIKSTLELLKAHFDKDILSADTGSVLSSAVALTMEHEQSLIRLHNTITECNVKNDNFCNHFHKKLKISASKLTETSEQLVDDIDEQMHKLLTKIVRKLKKFRNNVQNKWCHLKNEHDGTNDWLESSVLLECKKFDKKEYNSKLKSYDKSSKKIIENSLEYGEKHQNPEMVIDESFITETFLEHNNKQIKSDNYDKDKRILQKNWEQNKHNMKDSYEKDKMRRERIQNFSQNKKIKFQHTKPEWNENQKKTCNNPETKNDKRKESAYTKHYVIVEQGKTWPMLNYASSKQNNVSGDWILKLADGRAEQRKLSHRSDWLFDRADARKIKREKYQTKNDWYFQRVRGREDCRYNSYSDCKNENERKLPQTNYWSKKFTRTFATAGKWMKDSLYKFQNKLNYHHH